MNAADDGLAGVQQLAGDATMLFYMTEEGRKAGTCSSNTELRTSPGFPGVRDPPLRLWVAGARPVDAPAAVVPVLVGGHGGRVPSERAGSC